jgi:hypothetical protein
VFIGPSLGNGDLSGEIDYFWPASLGSIFQAAEAGYDVIGLVDGLFGNTPAVWHKEILYALSLGCEVIGGSSIGALRAAELSGCGMTGIGLIFRMYRRGLIEDDDELALVHAVKELECRPLTYPMIHVRLTMHGLRAGRIATRRFCDSFTALAKQRHFGIRDARCLADCWQAARDGASDPPFSAFAANYIDQKAADARRLIEVVASRTATRRAPAWSFPATSYWAAQFANEIADVPAADRRYP